jgi:hypothetical protein
MATIAVGLVLANTYWVLHGRQCRYYALTGLLLLITLMAYAYWQQRGRRLGELFFVVAAWCWFQVDYGSFWPVIGILLVLAAFRSWPHVTRTATVACALGAAIAPWVWYYELLVRLKTASTTPWSVKFLGNLFHMNQFMIPLLALIATGCVLALQWHKVAPFRRQLLLACLMILLASLLWVPSVATWFFYRYIVHLTPLAALIMAWLFVEAGKWCVRQRQALFTPTLVAVTMGSIVSFCPLPSNLVSRMITSNAMTTLNPLGTVVRPELAVLWKEVFGHRVDPNRAVIELIKARARPEDEILVTYEDKPFMFYTKNPIRGGIPAFRVEDQSSAPRFLVLRRSFQSLHWSVFKREVDRYLWNRIPVHAPDIPWGNNPEPDTQPAWMSLNRPDVIVAERVGYASTEKPPKRTSGKEVH